MRYKRIILILLVTTAPVYSGVSGEKTSNSYKTFYFGANVSADVTHLKTTMTDISLASGLVTRSGFNAMSNISSDGGGFLGIGKRFCNQFYAGLEAFFDVNDNNAKVEVFDANTNNIDGLIKVNFYAKHTYDVGISILPGFFVNDRSLFYARVGFVNGEFEMKGSGFAVFPTSAGQQVPFNFSRNVYGAQLGAGLETQLSESVYLRAEWDFNRYKSFQETVLKRTGQREGDLIFSNPRVNQFKFGLNWHLDHV
ncbi:TPA: outer membrane beta-barrel protein [Legionella anisa]|uniref:outer membrane protein n=1 Tax=Legionella anisa TaxID=28082 RepID=UPI00034C3541|nr:outer membrane beta-barrel protein [Legionella anisa]MCW8423102.1 porin family protein [Legionella anisa]